MEIRNAVAYAVGTHKHSHTHIHTYTHVCVYDILVILTHIHTGMCVSHTDHSYEHIIGHDWEEK